MSLQNFSHEEFARNLTTEAQEVIPKELTQDQGNYILNKVYQFAMVAGDALKKDPDVNLSVEQAQVIIQFIAEWTFHKSIDIIKCNIENKHWDDILQKLAFPIFLKAKETQINGMNSVDAAKIIEKEVNLEYQKIIKDLANAGGIKEDAVEEILTHSNLDDMTKKAYVPDPAIPQEETVKNAKYATLALLLKSISPERREKMMKDLGNKKELQAYLQDENLEKNLDEKEVRGYLDKINNSVITKKNEPPPINYLSLIKELSQEYSEKEIYNLVRFERKKINNFIAFALEEEPTRDMAVKFSQQLAKVVYRYIKAKLVQTNEA